MNTIYNDLREIIESGYLSIRVKLHGHLFVLRTPNFDDFSFIDNSTTSYTHKKILLVARCLVSFSYLEISEKDTKHLIRYVEKLPFRLIDRIYLYLLNLMGKERDAHDLLEPFCYERESRNLWQLWKAKIKFNERPLKTKLGSIHLAWIIWNEAEDIKIQSDHEWARASFIASTMSPSIPKIQAKWKSQEQNEQNRRDEIKKLAYEGKTMPRTKAKKVEDENAKLINEMKKWILGIEDEHDVAVREFKEEMKEHILKMQQVKEEQIQQARVRSEELEQALQVNTMVGLTHDQLKQKLGGSYTPSPTVSVDEGMGMSKVLSDMVFAKVTPGNYAVIDDVVVDISKKPNVEEQEPSLMEQISNRKPTI